jgi:hypothetical protein
MRRLAAVLWFTILTLAATVTAAAADGLPVPMDGYGVTTIVRPDGEGPRYATVPAGERTQLLRIDQEGGEVTRSRVIFGEFTIPLVALDGTASGLSADGGTLALIEPRENFRFPREETGFLIVDIDSGGRMEPREPITLRGDFSFDALSPDGDTMYLIEYRSRDYNDYAVREYDLERGRLLPEPVLVAHEVSPGEMRGLPVARVTSPDGRYEYTLYNGGGTRGDEAFIHALDTVQSVSHCIDVPALSGQQAWRADMELSPDGGPLEVLRGGEVVATLDTRLFAVGEHPVASAPEPPEGETADGGPGLLAIGAVAAGIALLATAALGLIRRRRRAPVPPADPFGAGEPEPEPVAIGAADRASERD